MSGTVTPGGPGRGAATSAASPGAQGVVLADWIHQVAAGNRGAACQDMREPGLSAKSSTAACMSAAGAATFNSLHGNFVADGIGPGTPISVTAPEGSGTSTTVNGTQVHVSGTTLDALMTAHSTGVKPGQLSIVFDLSRIDGAWYVTGMNMNV